MSDLEDRLGPEHVLQPVEEPEPVDSTPWPEPSPRVAAWQAKRVSLPMHPPLCLCSKCNEGREEIPF